MSYKIENGKVYKVEEVDVNEIEKEVKQAVAFIKQHSDAQKPYLTSIAMKQEERRAFNQKIDGEIASYQLVVDDHSRKIAEAQASLIDKKDVITQLYPQHKDILGF